MERVFDKPGGVAQLDGEARASLRIFLRAAMKFLPLLIVCLAALVLAGPVRAQAPKTQREKLGYALGAEIGQTFKEKGVDFDLAAFNAGLRDTMTGNRPQMTVAQQQEMIMSLTKGGGTAAGAGKASAADTAAADKHKRDGDAFLAVILAAGEG